jgi:hypothetical protein
MFVFLGARYLGYAVGERSRNVYDFFLGKVYWQRAKSIGKRMDVELPCQGGLTLF